MIQQIDAHLAKWIKQTINIDPSFEVPRNAGAGLGVNLYLYEIVQDPQLARSTRPFPQPALRYLVTAYGTNAPAAHEILGLLLTQAAQEHSLAVTDAAGIETSYRLELELEPMPSQIWSAFGIDPRPCFILRVQLPQDWPLRPAAPPAMLPPAVTTKPLISLHGLIRWRNESAIAPVIAARAELSSPHRQAYSDSQGRFVIGPLLPNDSQQYTLDMRLPNGLSLPLLTFPGAGSPEQPNIVEITNLFGLVTDSNDQPVSGAIVTLPPPERVWRHYRRQARRAFQLDPALPDDQIPAEHINHLLPDYLTPYRQAVTDFAGRFSIPAVLSTPSQWPLQIQAGERQFAHPITAAGTPTAPVSIRLQT